jgi:hypothetical protein
MSAPTFMVAMLAMLSQRAEVPEGVARCLDPSRVGLTMLPTRFNHRVVCR